MPSEHPVPAIHDQLPQEQSQGQIKLCSACHCQLSSDSPSTPFLLHDGIESSDTSIVCGPCRSRLVALRSEPPAARGGYFAEVERELLRRAASVHGGHNEASGLRQPSPTHPTHATDIPCLDEDADMGLPVSNASSSAPSEPNASSSLPQPASSAAPVSARPSLALIDTKIASPQVARSQSSVTQTTSASSSKSWSKAPQVVSTDPLVDITRLRVRSQGHHCLYPGATFQGTQKSGRNSYDVNVTIVDVDFSSSHLCGYLRIRGLTDDWPELTTYFDAEIIGSRYGFLTRNWGATEQDDTVHWARFPAFRHVRHELKKPHLTMKDANRSAVFMRWKEKFLVPDHRVQDINGASFAGFYYVCVDFNPQQSGSSGAYGSQPLASPESSSLNSSPLHTSPLQQVNTKPEHTPRARRMSSNQGARRLGRSQSRGYTSPPVATMSGFYFHQNSEPYQQLSLVHVPERMTSSFEFR